MKTYALKSLPKLIDAIGAGCDPNDRGPIVAKILLWDGRIVTGSYYKGSKVPNVNVPEDIVTDDELLRPFVEKLLNESKSFVVETGTDDMLCTIEWKIGT